MKIPNVILHQKLMDFLREDVGFGDITTEAVVPVETKIRAQIILKESAMVAGILETKTLFEILGAEFTSLVEDGEKVSPGKVIAEVKGHGSVILTAERTALNILTRMSGIATATGKLVEKIRDAGLDVRIAATRKTAPGLRYFDKKAVFIGGGDPHRLRLDDAFLIKDNHVEIAGGIKKAMRKAHSISNFSKKIEIEVKKKDQAIEAAKLGADIIMLDNMTLKEAMETIKALKFLNLRNKVLIEISGGITEQTLLDYANLEPNVISLGLLTQCVRATDMSLEVVEVGI